MKILPILAVLCASALAACAGSQKGAIVPGKPFVVLRNVDADCVRARLLARLAERGWTVKSMGGGRLEAENAAPAFINSVARQAGYARPLVRMTVVGVAVGPNIELIVDPFVVTNAGTPNERLQPIEPTAEMQQAIDDAGRDLEGHCALK